MTRDVLVIDDSATVRKLVEISLRGRQLRAHFADSGGEGIRRAAALAPSAILLDFMLPDMTGVEVCRALAADVRTRGIPILVVTAKHERTRSEFDGFPAVVDFIGKPFAAPDLIARIDRAIAGAAAHGTGVTARPAAAGTLATGRPAAIGTVATGRITEPRQDVAERAAKLLFARLRDGLALLPSQFRSLEPGPIAPQLARRLLTPQVVEGILADLRPLCAELAERGGHHRHDEPTAAPAPAPAHDAIVDRVAGFSAKVQGAQLGSLDRRILALADGRLSVAEIAGRLAIDHDEAATAVAALIGRGLVQHAPAVPAARPVVICEPDVEAFQEPLRGLLARRAQPRELVAVDRVDDVAGAVRQHQACLAIVNATSRVAEACAAARALRADLALSDLAMVAVVEARAAAGPDLVSAGFDAVLAKPVMVTDLERFLIPADLR